jgi:N-acetylglucosamine kinase-like BadF-type ATPase
MTLPPLFIFDAGSTKTDLIIYKDETITARELSGYNPNRNDGQFLSELKALSIPIDSEIHFYGSGLGKEVKKNQLSDLFNSHNVSYNNDLIGAARATLGTSSGIISIMGTGGVVGYYDGKKITDQKGGYGYLIDDFGGGLELAKTIVSGWLNKLYHPDTNQKIENYFNSDIKTFISTFYQSKDLHHLASVCKLLPDLIKEDFKLEKTVKNYFNVFFDRHVSLMCHDKGLNHINLVGSLALNFYNLINKTASLHDIRIRSCIDKPIQYLLKYHLTQKR